MILIEKNQKKTFHNNKKKKIQRKIQVEGETKLTDKINIDSNSI